jgi:hypothetical protein
MWLPSRLERSTLGDLLGGLHRGGVSGRLDVIDDETALRAAIHFERGHVVRIDGSGPRLGERVARSWDERARIDAALTNAARSGDLAGAALVQRGLATAGQLRTALEQQARERIERLYAVRRADLRFHVASQSGRGLELPMGPATFLHGRPRAVRRADPVVERPALDPLREALVALGLPPSATPSRDAVRRAFRVRAGALHPDRARDPETRAILSRAFTALAVAYDRALAAC